MNLADRAKAKAKQEQDAQKAQRDNEQAENGRLQKIVDQISKQTVKGLKDFHNVECSQGTLKLLTGKKAKEAYGFQTYNNDHRLAVLMLDRSKHGMTNANILWVEGEVYHGTADYSDDVRDVPYTTPSVSIYNDWKWSSSTNRTDSLGLGRFVESARSEKEVEKMLQKLADFLAPLFITP